MGLNFDFVVTRYQAKIKLEQLVFQVRSYEPSTLHLSNHINREHLFCMFCLQVFCQARPPQQVQTA